MERAKLIIRDTRKNRRPELDARGKFAKGNNGGSGRTPGIPNKLTGDIRQAIVQAAAEVGFDANGEQGLLGYLKFLAIEHPPTFASLLAKTIPQQIHAEINEHVTTTFQTRDEVEAELKRRGLPVPVLLDDEQVPLPETLTASKPNGSVH